MSYDKLCIGILALQGAFREHAQQIQTISSEISVKFIKKESDFSGIDGIILPGGESTAMYLINKALLDKIKLMINDGLPVFGTCAGLILLADTVYDSVNSSEKKCFMGFLEIEVVRNYFGSQIDSFETELEVSFGTEKEIVHAVFIRAPVIRKVADNVKILCKARDLIVGIEKDNVLGICFHPELTSDLRFHKYFLDKVIKAKKDC